MILEARRGGGWRLAGPWPDEEPRALPAFWSGAYATGGTARRPSRSSGWARFGPLRPGAQLQLWYVDEVEKQVAAGYLLHICAEHVSPPGRSYRSGGPDGGVPPRGGAGGPGTRGGARGAREESSQVSDGGYWFGSWCNGRLHDRHSLHPSQRVPPISLEDPPWLRDAGGGSGVFHVAFGSRIVDELWPTWLRIRPWPGMRSGGLVAV